MNISVENSKRSQLNYKTFEEVSSILNTEKVGTKCILHKAPRRIVNYSTTFNMSNLYHYHGDKKKIILEEIDIQYDFFTSLRELIDALHDNSITTRCEKYTQYLV